MNEPIHNARTLVHTVLPLDAMKEVARAWDATLNDVALCVLDAAMNRYLRRIGRPPERPLVAICPVSLQDPQAKQATTRVSVFWTPLGSPSAAVGRRMRQVAAQTRAAKERIRDLPRDAAYAYSVLTFVMGETLAMIPRGSQDFFVPSNVLISNVRGPAEPMFLGGARLEALVPVSTLISGMGLNITFMSYAGRVVIGYTANASALPDAQRLAFLALLEQIIANRIADQPEGSYTAKLFGEGPGRIAQKIGEEGVEVALAAVTRDDDGLVAECADLLYHVLLLLKSRDLSLERVVDELKARHASKG